MSTEIGLSDFHYAIVETDTKTALVYKAPVSIVNLIAASITPNIVESVLSADNGPAESHSALSKVDVEIELAALTLKEQAELLGHTFAAGGIVKKGSDVAPYVAIGFKSLKTNGKYRYMWLKKGKFSEPTRAHKTQGEQVEYNTAKIKASFVLTAYDNAWEASIDEDETTYAEADGTAWFTDTTLATGLAATAAPTP